MSLSWLQRLSAWCWSNTPQWPPCVQYHQSVLVSICQTGLAEAHWTAYSQGAPADLLYRFPCRREIKPVQILWRISSEPFWGELPWHSHLDSIALPTRSAIVQPTCYSDLKEWCFHSALRNISQPHILVLGNKLQPNWCSNIIFCSLMALQTLVFTMQSVICGQTCCRYLAVT